jgi:hypothetical protein
MPQTELPLGVIYAVVEVSGGRRIWSQLAQPLTRSWPCDRRAIRGRQALTTLAVRDWTKLLVATAGVSWQPTLLDSTSRDPGRADS